MMRPIRTFGPQRDRSLVGAGAIGGLGNAVESFTSAFLREQGNKEEERKRQVEIARQERAQLEAEGRRRAEQDRLVEMGLRSPSDRFAMIKGLTPTGQTPRLDRFGKKMPLDSRLDPVDPTFQQLKDAERAAQEAALAERQRKDAEFQLKVGKFREQMRSNQASERLRASAPYRSAQAQEQIINERKRLADLAGRSLEEVMQGGEWQGVPFEAPAPRSLIEALGTVRSQFPGVTPVLPPKPRGPLATTTVLTNGEDKTRDKIIEEWAAAGLDMMDPTTAQVATLLRGNAPNREALAKQTFLQSKRIPDRATWDALPPEKKAALTAEYDSIAAAVSR